jgi:hypothetical protein
MLESLVCSLSFSATDFFVIKINFKNMIALGSRREEGGQFEGKRVYHG